MNKKNKFPNIKQTSESKACGPICLANIYKYLGIKYRVENIFKDLKINNKTITYVPQLAEHLQSFKLEVVILNSNPFITSPSWKNIKTNVLIDKFVSWSKLNKENRWYKKVKYFISYLKKGGKINIVDLTTKLIDRYLNQGYLLIACLEESWIWGERKILGTVEFNDIKGTPGGHFVVLYGQENNDYLISDPYPTGLKNRDGLYKLNKDKLLVATLVWSGQIIAVKK